MMTRFWRMVAAYACVEIAVFLWIAGAIRPLSPQW